MILSSSDILKILNGSQILRLEADVKIVDGRPSLSGQSAQLSISVAFLLLRSSRLRGPCT